MKVVFLLILVHENFINEKFKKSVFIRIKFRAVYVRHLK